MSTDKPRHGAGGGDAGLSSESMGGPSPFTEEEVRAATQGPPGEPELEDVDAADIDQAGDERGADFEPFDRLVVRSRRLSPEKVQAVLESILFVAERPLSVDQLWESTGIERETVARGLEALTRTHHEGAGGMVLYEVASGWQLRTDPSVADYVRRYLRVKPQRLTRAAVETLAILAYRQPVTRPEVEDIRGVDCGAVIKALLDRRLIKILGKKEEVGRPILYGTTEEFLEFFALKDLSALPTLREFQELTQEHQDIVEKEALPVKPVADVAAEGMVAALQDNTFQAKLDETTAESEAALEELEKAISSADERTKEVAAVLNPKLLPDNTPGELAAGAVPSEPGAGPNAPPHAPDAAPEGTPNP